MTLLVRRALTALACALLLPMAHAAPFQMLGTHSATELGKWGANWWIWALSSPEGSSPIDDLTGKNCAVNQAGPVWFLAGTYENGTPVRRTCTVPAGKTVLFPLINTYGLGNTQAECSADLNNNAAGFDRVQIEYLKVDGKSINTSQTRGKVACFYLPQHKKWLGVDGYWAIAKFQKGRHTISFKASKSNFAQNISYSLTQK